MLKDKIIKTCDQIIEYGILAIIFFIPIIFDFTVSSYNLIDLYKIAVFRIVLIFMLLAYTAKIFITGRLSYRGSAIIFWLIFFLLTSFFISSLFSLDSGQSFWGSFLRQQGFYNFFNYLLFFVLIVLNFKNFRQIKRVIIAVVCSASLVAIYGLIQFFNLDPIYWSERAPDSGRIFSTLGQPNFFGHWLIMVLPLSLYALIFMAKRLWVKFLVGLAWFLQLICLIFTYSRAAWLGFLGSLVYLIIGWLFYKRHKKIALSFIGLMLVGAIAVIGLNFIQPAGQTDLSAGYGNLNSINLLNRLKGITDFKSGSNKMRLYYLESAVKEIKQAGYDRLLAGFGPEALAKVFIKYYRIDWGVYESINSYPDRAHNWLFDQILALGFLGLAVNLIFFIYFVYKMAAYLISGQKLGKKLEPDGWLLIFLGASLAAYFINNIFSFSLFTVLVYLYLILALGWIIINCQVETREINIRLTVFSKVLVWAALLAVATIFIYTNNINQVRAEIYYIKAMKSMKIPDCQGVENNLKKTLSLNPNSRYYQENYLFLMVNCFPLVDKKTQIDLRDNMLERIKFLNADESYDVLINIARSYTMFGRYLDKAYYTEAEKIFNNLLTDFTYFTTAYEDLSKQKMMQADYSGAIEIFMRALNILPPLDHPYLNNQHRRQIEVIALRLYEGLGRAYWQTKNYDLALDYYKKGLKLDPRRATLYKSIADVYYIQGRLDEAIIWNKRGLMLNPVDYHWPLAISLLYRDRKNLAEAKKYLNQAIKLAPDNQELKKYYEELNK